MRLGTKDGVSDETSLARSPDGEELGTEDGVSDGKLKCEPDTTLMDGKIDG
jgi:hypothetical protein